MEVIVKIIFLFLDQFFICLFFSETWASESCFVFWFFFLVKLGKEFHINCKS